MSRKEKFFLSFLVYYILGTCILLSLIYFEATQPCGPTALCPSKEMIIERTLVSPVFWLTVTFWPILLFGQFL